MAADSPPIMFIDSPGAALGTEPPIISADTPVNIVSDNPDGDPAPWQLWLIPSGGTQSLLASSSSSIGEAPSNSAQAAIIHPADLPNGLCTIELTDAEDNIKDSKIIDVQTMIKLGNLTLPFTDLTMNASGSQPIPITRTYDSSLTSTDTGMGYGWSLNVTGNQIQSTVSPQLDSQEYPGYADGDLLYLTTPDGTQHTFEFLAQPTGDIEDNPVGSLLASVETYYPQFVCVDGSGAKLNLLSDGEPVGSEFTLVQSEGRYVDSSNTGDFFNPANPVFDMTYNLVTADGTSYSFDPSTGRLASATDANGNVTNYADPPYTDATVSGSDGIDHISAITDTATGQVFDYYYDAADNLIGTIDAVGAKTTYLYGDQLLVPDTASGTVYAEITRASDNDVWSTTANGGNGGWVTYNSANASQYQISLSPILDANSHVQWYSAQGPAIAPGTPVSIAYYSAGSSSAISTQTRNWSAPHFLTGIIDSNGVTVLTATYDPASNLLTSLVNTLKQSSGVSTGGFDGTTGDQSVTDAAGDATEDIYDQYGDITRKIQTITDSNGNITSYLVTVSTFSYFNTQNDDAASTGVDLLNTPINETDYAPFEITGTDPNGLRYTQQPSTPPQQIINYYVWNGDESSLTDTDLGKPETEMTLVGPDGATGNWLYNTTTFGTGYTTLGNPTQTTQQLGEYSVDSSGDATLVASVGPSATTNSAYDSDGNLTSSTDSTGVTTSYIYTTAGNVAGLLQDTYRSSSIATGGKILISSNTYYDSTDSTTGALAGMLASTTTYNYEIQNGSPVTLAQTTYYVYDAQGNVLLSYISKNIGTSAAPDWVWTASFTTYDQDGQSLSTSQATYINPANVDGPMTVNVTWSTNAAISPTTGTATVSYTLYASVPTLPSSQASYTPDGQTATTTDQYGGVTVNTYNASGQLVRTLYPTAPKFAAYMIRSAG